MRTMSKDRKREVPQVLVVGADGVGRTCAVMWFAYNRYVLDDLLPVCFDTFRGTVGDTAVDLVDGPEVLLDPESSVFNMEYGLYVQRAVGMLAVFDVTSRKTMADAYTVVERTQRLRAEHDLAPLPFAVIGTHIDQVDARTVTADEARAEADAHGARYAEVNAVTGENVHAAFTDAIAPFLAAAPALNDNTNGGSDSRARHGCTHQ